MLKFEDEENIGIDVEFSLIGEDHYSRLRNVYSIICFPGREIIVSSHSKKKVRVIIWKISITEKTWKQLHLVEDDIIKGSVKHIIKFRENSFLTASKDTQILCFSIESPFRVLKKFSFNTVEVVRLAMIDEDRFISVNVEDEILVISFSRNRAIKRIEDTNYSEFNTKIVLSMTFENAFYLNTIDTGYPVKAIDYEKGHTIRSYSVHRFEVFAIDSFISSSSNEEILTVGGGKEIYLYHVSDKENRSSVYRVLKTSSDSKIHSLFTFGNSLLFSGSDSGDLTIFNMNTNKIIASKQIHKSSIFDIELIQHRNENVILMSSCSRDESINVFAVNTVKTKDFDLVVTFFRERQKAFLENSLLAFVLEKDRSKSQVIDMYSEEHPSLVTKALDSFGNQKITSMRSRRNSRDPTSAVDDIFLSPTSTFRLRLRNLLEQQIPLSSNIIEYEDGKLFVGSTRNIPPNNSSVGEKEQEGFGIELGPIKKKKKRTGSSYLIRPVYVGFWNLGKRHGKGSIYSNKKVSSYRQSSSSPGGDGRKNVVKTNTYFIIFDGVFRNGQRDGIGREFTNHFGKNSTDSMMNSFIKFEGIFKGGKRCGRGEMYDFKKQKFVQGVWEDDNLDESTIFNFDCPIIRYDEIKKHLKDSHIIGKGAYGIVYKIALSSVSFLKEYVYNSSSLSTSKKRRQQQQQQHQKEKYIAIKVMRYGNSFEKEILFNMVKRGMELCSRVKDSKNLLKTYCVFSGENTIGYVMRWCKMSIHQLIKLSSSSSSSSASSPTSNKEHISNDEKYRFLLESAKGIRELHLQNIMHRDLKWDNILLDENSSIQLTDFDTLREDERQWRMTTQTLTTKVGTAGWLAPEVFGGKKYGLSCDVFSYAMMIYTLFCETNHPYYISSKNGAVCPSPTCGTSVASMARTNTISHHVSECGLRPDIESEEDVVSKIPKMFMDLMIQCWDADPGKRPSFEEIVRRIEDEKMKNKYYTMIKVHFVNLEEEEEEEEEEEGGKIVKTMLIIQPLMKNVMEWIENNKPVHQSEQGNCRRIVVNGIKNTEIGEICTDEDVFELVKKDLSEIFVYYNFSDAKENEKEQIQFYDKKEEQEEQELVLHLKSRNEELEGVVRKLSNVIRMMKGELEETDREKNLWKEKAQKLQQELIDMTLN